MSYTKAVLRTIFYQNFLLIIGLVVGFILNAEYVGWKAPLVNKSIKNIFYPIEMDDQLCKNIKQYGATRIWAEIGRPRNFMVIEDGLAAEEWYVAKVSYLNKDNKEVVDILSTRVRWKPWEYYYNNTPHVTTEEELREYYKKGTLNSKETDKALKLYHEQREMNQQKLKI